MGMLYERDFFAWTAEQAALLRAGRFAEADITNLVEEIESMGRGERRELVNRLNILLTHLLKWRYQPKRRGMSWRNSIRSQRIQLSKHLLDNPSLKPNISEALQNAYTLACLAASTETKLRPSLFPETCPWSFEQAMDDGFWPAPDPVP